MPKDASGYPLDVIPLPDVCIVSQAPTASSSPAYSSGDVIGSLMTFDGITRANDVTGILQQATIHCKSAQAAAVDLLIFGANPTNSTFTDNAALAVNSADWDKVTHVIHFTDWTNLGTPSLAQADNLAKPFKPESGSKKLYGVLVSRATPTLASTGDIKVTLKSLPN